MPHMWIECSSNIENEPEVRSLKKALYEAVVKAEIFPVAGIRIRMTAIDDYIVGDASPENSFIHVVLRMGVGRDEATQRQAAEDIFAAIKGHLQSLSDRKPLAVAFEMQEMHPTLNFKFNNLRSHMARQQQGA
jgi:5-carboxymethyl-2-hydroxymuconate isomerase